MKKVFIIISKDAIRRNILDTSFLSYLLEKKKDYIFTLIVEKDKINFFKKKYSKDRVEVVGYERKHYSLWHSFVFFLVRNGVNSHSTKLYRMRSLYLGDSNIFQVLIKNILASFFGRINLYKKFVRFLVRKLKFHDVQDIFRKEKPIAIFIPSLIDNDFDIPFAIEARRYGIDVLGMVRSWDNLNNHGLLAFVPDLLILQNEWLKEAGYKFQDFSNKRPKIEFAGLPHYDKYFNFKDRIKPRDLFFKELGLDPSKKLILLGGSDFYYTENKLPQIIDNLIEENKINKPAQILFRPHPSGLFGIDEYGLDGLKNIILNDAFSNSKIKFTDDDILINIFYYSDIIINIASTLSIDAAVFDKPVICIGFDAVPQKYWLSAKRLYDSFDHYEKLLSTGGVCLVKNIEELARNINLYLEYPEKDHNGRVEIVKVFTGGKSGDSSKKLADIVSLNI